MLAWLRLYRRYFVGFAATVMTVFSIWLSVALAYSSAQPAASEHLTVGDVLAAPGAFAIMVAPVYGVVVLVIEWPRRERIRRAWTAQHTAYRAADYAARSRAAALTAAFAAALERARAAMASACYCHRCDGCFWPAPPGGGIPAPEVLAPDRFREALARAGGYAELADYYHWI